MELGLLEIRKVVWCNELDSNKMLEKLDALKKKKWPMGEITKQKYINMK